MVTKKQTIGFLAIVLTLVGAIITGIVITQDNLSISIKPNAVTFKSKVGSTWVTTGIEKLYIDGVLMSGKLSQELLLNNVTKITRTNSTWYDYYIFNGNVKNVETFPVSHQIHVQGQKGKQFKYVVTSLKGVTGAHSVVSGENFGYNMKVNFDDGYTSAKVTKAGTMTVIYTIPSDDWTLNVRLFDPDPLILTTTTANYTINTTSGLITQIKDLSSGENIISGPYGCGYTLRNGSGWSGGITYPLVGTITILEETASSFAFIKMYGQVNSTQRYWVENGALYSEVNFTAPISIGAYNNSEIRMICNISFTYMDNKSLSPWDTTIPASKGLINITTIATSKSTTLPFSPKDIGSGNYILISNRTNGIMFAELTPIGDKISGASSYRTTFRIDRTSVQGVTLQYISPNINPNVSTYRWAITLTKDLSGLQRIYNNTRDDDNINGTWLNTCFSTYSITKAQLQEMYDYGVRMWNMNCWLPDDQIFPANGTWYPEYFYGGQANFSMMNQKIAWAREVGIEPYVYYVSAELNMTTAEAYYSSDIAMNYSLRYIYSTYPNRYYMSFDNPNGWYKNSSNDIQLLMNNLPNMSGIFLDINMLRDADYNSSTDNSWWYNSTQQSFSFISVNYYKWLKNITQNLYNNNKSIILNGVTQPNYLALAAGKTEDTDNIAQISANKISAINKPTYFIPLNNNESSYINELILWGVYPSKSYNSTRYNYTARDWQLIQYLTNDKIVDFSANESGTVNYVEYTNYITFNSSSLNYTSMTPKDFIRVNDGVYVGANTTVINISQLSDGYTDIIEMRAPSGCNVIPSENLQVGTSINLCSGTYNLNDTDANGAINITTGNIILTCMNTILIDTSATSDNIGIYSAGGVNNVTIIGCTLQGYYTGMWLRAGLPDNYTIRNNNFISNRDKGFYTYANVGLKFYDNNFVNSSIYLSGNDNFQIYQNNFSGCSIGKCGNTRNENIRIDTGSYNGSIYNNNLVSGEVGIYINGDGGNLNVYNNNLTYHDRGMKLLSLSASPPFNIYNNNFVNNTNNYDTYELDIGIVNVSNVNIYNNTFYESVDMSINAQNISNMVFANNTFNMVCLINRDKYNGNPQNEPCTAIKIGQLYKTWNYLCAEPYTQACVRGIISSNISILDNKFNDETQVYLYLEGAYNITHNFDSGLYWYRSFTPYNYTDTVEMYINSNTNYLNTTIKTYNKSSSLYSFYYAYANGAWKGFFKFGLSKTEQYYLSTNVTMPTILNLTNQTRYYPLNDIKNQTVTLLNSANNFNKTLLYPEVISVGFFNSSNRINKNLTVSGILCPINDTCIVSLDFDLAEVSS